jgi:ankyrin repeat protein
VVDSNIHPQGHDGIVRLLLQLGADVNAQGGGYGNALLAASAEGNEEIVKLLIDYRAVSEGSEGENELED